MIIFIDLGSKNYFFHFSSLPDCQIWANFRYFNIEKKIHISSLNVWAHDFPYVWLTWFILHNLKCIYISCCDRNNILHFFYFHVSPAYSRHGQRELGVLRHNFLSFLAILLLIYMKFKIKFLYIYVYICFFLPESKFLIIDFKWSEMILIYLGANLIYATFQLLRGWLG